MITKTKIMMAPRKLKIARKSRFWAVNSLPGSHKKDSSIPLLIALRDYLKLGDKEREITRIMANSLVMVDGKVVKERRRGIGFMDTLTVSGNDYLVSYDRKGKLVILPKPGETKGLKLLRVKGKTYVKGGRIQISFHDGSTMVTDRKDIKNGDSVLVKIPKKEIVDVLKFAPGNRVFITGGSHVGEIATIKSIEIKSSSGENMVHMNEGFSTVSSYVFVMASPKYTFSMPEAIAE
ncbi:30S ribosomal protein S4e [Picrophilus oshimae]|uniref:Small ribosomal subunit protein eS4 n=1 Tax=Picrophilus torridus (strain ATCC 700027 / DSM 9790 / JCM 10055 / NBRC 100828 / KAW 2/3) TaxID=1122961 RepID=A0A8G2FVX1_PICTO|nr:30S ribosomal protein S4e [Picrophilus oshimae]SMD30457.1 SSU ribosomal protein S4E [Picrophilus oshimae DSM 9789]